MKLKFTLFIFLVFCSYVNAQKTVRVFKGNVIDSATSKPIPDVSVCVYRASDTSLVQFGFTTPNGNYSLSVTSTDSLLIVFSLLNYEDVTIKKSRVENLGYWMFESDDIKLNRSLFVLKSFKVSTAAIRMKGDTMEINANKFKVLPGSDVAQLFKKIPGFEVNVKGEIKVDGTTVSKILVDGSDFFGNNPGLVSKNLNADMIETVQVFDPKNPDGSSTENQEKVINLKLKKNKKNGLFGDAMAGYGNKDRYEAGLRLNGFKNDRKLSFIVNSNNINETGFDFGFNNWHDVYSSSRNGSGNDNDVFYYYNNGDYSNKGNLNNDLSSAFTYFNEFSKKRKLSINGSIGQNVFSSINTSQSINAINDSTSRINKDSSNTVGTFKNAKINIDYTKTIDSTGEFGLGVYGNVKDLNKDRFNLNEIMYNNSLINSGKTNFKDLNEGFNYGGEISFNRSLRKNDRYYFQVSSSFNQVINENKNVQYSDNNKDTFNNQRIFDLNKKDWLMTLTGVMPLYKKINLSLISDRYFELNKFNQIASGAFNQRKSDFNQVYNSNIDSLKLNFENSIEQLSTKPTISFRNKTIFFSTGATLIQYNLINNNLTLNEKIDKTYDKLLPNFRFYFYNKIAYLNFSASQNVEFPTVNDLAPVINYQNNWQRNIGNPNLKPVINNKISFYGSSSKLKHFRYLYANFTLTQSNNTKITENTNLEDGSIVLRPINASGYLNLRSYLSTSFKLYKSLYLGNSINHSKISSPYIINNIKSFNHNDQITLSPSLEISFSDSLELSLYSSFTFANFNNTANSSLNFKQNTNSLEFSLRTILKFGTELNTDFTVNNQSKVPGIGKVIYVWNAYLQQPIDKNGKYNIKITAYDILNQNTRISRINQNGYVYISQNNQLQQYFMLSLIYKIKSSNTSEADEFVY